MSLILKMLHLGDNKKDREYVSDAGKFLKELDIKNPKLSLSQKQEVAKHRDIFKRKAKSIL
jgi:hypothetical protein